MCLFLVRKLLCLVLVVFFNVCVGVYVTGHTSWVVSVCMGLLVCRGTSWHKGVVVIVGLNCCWVPKMFLSHTPPRGGQELLACMCVHVLFGNTGCCVHSAGVGQ